MSVQSYSCTMSEQRSEDHVHRLLIAVLGFIIAAAVFGWTAVITLPYPVLPWVSGALFLGCIGAGVMCFWAWWDTHDDV